MFILCVAGMLSWLQSMFPLSKLEAYCNQVDVCRSLGHLPLAEKDKKRKKKKKKMSQITDEYLWILESFTGFRDSKVERL